MVRLFLFFSLFSIAASKNSVFQKFSKEAVLCDVSERLRRGCSAKILKVRSLLECLSGCALDTSCIGASQDKNEVCFHHKECPFISGCTHQHHDHTHMTKYCAHGTWNVLTQSCECVDGTYGDRCNEFYTLCEQFLSLGYKRGLYKVYLNLDVTGKKPILTHCYLDPDSPAADIVMLVNRGEKPFHKMWWDYVRGFYYDDGHFWGGLYAWHKFSHLGCDRVYISFGFHTRETGLALYRQYQGFKVKNETTKYSFAYKNSSAFVEGTRPQGNHFGDCLNSLQNVPFSTWDADHDGNTDQNCAARAGSGWWYSGCDNPCNMLGFGLKYWNTKPRYQVFSLLGTNMSLIGSESPRFVIYIECPLSAIGR